MIAIREPLYREVCADVRHRSPPVWPRTDPDHRQPPGISAGRVPAGHVPDCRVPDRRASSEPDTVPRFRLPDCCPDADERAEASD